MLLCMRAEGVGGLVDGVGDVLVGGFVENRVWVSVFLLLLA